MIVETRDSSQLTDNQKGEVAAYWVYIPRRKANDWLVRGATTSQLQFGAEQVKSHYRSPQDFVDAKASASTFRTQAEADEYIRTITAELALLSVLTRRLKLSGHTNNGYRDIVELTKGLSVPRTIARKTTSKIQRAHRY